MITLRPYQLHGVDMARKAIAARKRRLILLSPTGSGKTIIACSVIEAAVAKGKRILFVAHRKELINQASVKLDEFGIEHGVIMGNHWRNRPNAPVQVASIQTLRNRALPWDPDLIIIDEAHLSMAKSYTDLLDRYPAAVTLGPTATPIRADGKPLGDIYHDIISISTVPQLIRMGFLVRPRHFAPTIPNLADIAMRGADYDDAALAGAIDKPDLVGDIVQHWRKIAAGRTTAVFAITREHSQHIVRQFLAAGITAEHVDGLTPAHERDAIFRRFASGETTVVSNVGIFVEGYDNPRISAVVLARPTMSLARYLQMAGRGLRIMEGKQDCIILDHAGCAHAHGMVDDEREWSLTGKKKRGGGSRLAPVRTCDKCYATYPAQVRGCPECGYAPPSQDREIVEDTSAKLVEITDEMRLQMAKQKRREEAQAQTLADLLSLAKVRGYSPGWAHHRWKARQKRYA